MAIGVYLVEGASKRERGPKKEEKEGEKREFSKRGRATSSEQRASALCPLLSLVSCRVSYTTPTYTPPPTPTYAPVRSATLRDNHPPSHLDLSTKIGEPNSAPLLAPQRVHG